MQEHKQCQKSIRQHTQRFGATTSTCSMDEQYANNVIYLAQKSSPNYCLTRWYTDALEQLL